MYFSVRGDRGHTLPQVGVMTPPMVVRDSLGGSRGLARLRSIVVTHVTDHTVISDENNIQHVILS